MGIIKGICGGNKETAKRMMKLAIEEMKKVDAEKKENKEKNERKDKR